MAKKVMIDAGHGGRDYGAVYEELKEKDDNLRMAMDIGRLLEENGIEVRYTRTSDVYKTPYERAVAANREGVDFFLSLHRNAFPEPGKASGVSAYVYSEDNEAAGVARAMTENLEAEGFVDRGVEARPDLVVLKRTEMPAVLLQVGYLDSDADNALFEENYEGILQAIVEAILQAFMEENTGEGDQKPTESYRVQVGVFRIESNARKLLEDLVAEGFLASVIYEDGYYKVLVGDYPTMQEAVEMEQLLRDYGYATVLLKRNE